MTPLDLTCRKTPPRQLSRLSEVAAGYDGLIIDVWGVLHDGVAVYDDAVDALIAVRDTGKRVVLLTNSSRRADNLADMLDALGIARSLYDTIISSGEAAAAALANPAMYRRLGSSCLVVGTQQDDDWIWQLPVRFTDEVTTADFCLTVGLLPEAATLEDYLPLLECLRARAVPMVCANPDKEVIIGGIQRIAVGSLASRYRNLGGDVLLFGKPAPPIYDACFAACPGLAPDRVLAVGDSLETDIAGANGYGIASVLVSQTGIVAGYTCGDSGCDQQLLAEIRRLETFPDAIVPRFIW